MRRFIGEKEPGRQLGRSDGQAQQNTERGLSMLHAILSDDGNFRNTNGAVVGRLAVDRYLEKRGLDFRKHHLHRFGGWATESSHIDQLRAAGGRGVRLVLRDGRVFESSLSLWEQHGYRPSSLHSAQTVLSDRFWTVAVPGVRQLALSLSDSPATA